jgi:putative RNA 2'-phosphotransferase
MNDRALVRKSKRLSWLLRHGAGEVGLTMDAAGWAPVAEVLAHTRLSPAELAHVVARNNKGRLQLEGERVRACQGHSTDDMPVTAEALEASWARAEVDTAWHGTSPGVVDAILADGLHPMRRTHVHLAPSPDSRVGKRASVAVLLQICVRRLEHAGLPLWRSPNGVLLVRRVPPGCIVALRPISRRARAQAPSWRAALRPDPLP